MGMFNDGRKGYFRDSKKKDECVTAEDETG